MTGKDLNHAGGNMFGILRFLILLMILSFHSLAYAHERAYGAKLCKDTAHYQCHIAKRGETWAKLFPNGHDEDLVMRINRIGIELEPGMRIAVPLNMSYANVMDYSPFPKEITPLGGKAILVSLDQMAWGAYDERGTLVRWGPASTAIGYCPDEHRSCHTAQGKFFVYRKEGEHCVSTKFPIPRGGAPMPYCMYFHGGFALHGSYELPGYNASHGCVRLFIPDAKWLNEEFLSQELQTTVIVTQQ